MTLKPRPSLYLVFVLVSLLFLWLIAVFLFVQPPLGYSGLRSALIFIAVWLVMPAIWFVIDDYVLKTDPNLTRLQRHSRDLWVAVGIINFLLIVGTIIANQLNVNTRGPVAWNLVVDVIHTAIWPLVVLLSLALFRKPLGDFFSALGRRASKIGAFNVSIELTNLPEARQLSVGLNDLKSEYPMAAGDSSGSLFQAIADTTQADYITVNLEEGEAWLTSRLFILAVLVPRVRPIKRIVFLGGPSEEFLGEARPSDVGAALAAKYEWLEKAYIGCHVYAYQEAPNINKLQHTNPLVAPLDPNSASPILGSFLHSVQGQPEPAGWVQFANYAEHAEWISEESLVQLLGTRLNRSNVKRDPAGDEVAATRTLLRTDADYVAVVDTFGRFLQLVDRYRALDQVIREQIATTS